MSNPHKSSTIRKWSLKAKARLGSLLLGLAKVVLPPVAVLAAGVILALACVA